MVSWKRWDSDPTFIKFVHSAHPVRLQWKRPFIIRRILYESSCLGIVELPTGCYCVADEDGGFSGPCID